MALTEDSPQCPVCGWLMHVREDGTPDRCGKCGNQEPPMVALTTTEWLYLGYQRLKRACGPGGTMRDAVLRELMATYVLDPERRDRFPATVPTATLRAKLAEEASAWRAQNCPILLPVRGALPRPAPTSTETAA